MEPLKLVVIEDEEAHFELMRRAISKELPSASLFHFQDNRAFFEKCDEVLPDVIVADYLTPGMNGLELLNALNGKGERIPVIIVTGQGDEGIAVKALKEGASDYLVKSPDFFTLLPSIIKKTIGERKLKNSLREFQNRFRDLAESTSDWIWEVDAQGRYTYSNPAVKDITGYHPDEIAGRRFEDFFPQNSKRAQRKAILQIMGEGKPISGYISCTVDRYGKEVFLETSGVPILDPSHKLLGYRGIDRNVTRRMLGEQRLRKSEALFRALFEQVAVGVAEIDTSTGRFLRANKRYADILGTSVEELHNTLFQTITHPEDLQAHLAGISLMKAGKIREFEMDKRYIRKDGTVTWVRIAVSPLWEPGEAPARHIAVVNDISQRKRAEEEVRIQRETLEKIFESAPYIMMVVNQEGRVSKINRIGAAFSGRPKEEVMGLLGGEVFNCLNSFDGLGCGKNPECSDCPIRPKVMLTFQTGESIHDAEGRMTVRRGSMDISIDMLISTALVKDRDSDFVLVTVADITKRKRAEEALRESERGLRFLSSKLLSAQEEERKKIARELHDSLGGSLSAIKVSLVNTRKQFEKGEGTPELLEVPIAWTQNLIDEARRLMSELRPSVLDDMGVIAAVEWFFRQYKRTYPIIHVEEKICIQEEEVPQPLKTVIFRITQEAFHNIAKYSRAEFASFTLLKNNSAIALIIEDCGDGFDLEATLLESSDKRGLGITSMKERCELSGGTFRIDSHIGEGTEIRASWPIGNPA